MYNQLIKVGGTPHAMDLDLGRLQEMVRDWEARRAAVHVITKSQHNWVTEQQPHLRGDHNSPLTILDLETEAG